MKIQIVLTAASLLFTLGVSGQASFDTCAAAAADTNPITAAGTFSIALVDGSEVPDPVCADNGGGATAGEWYKFVPPISETVTVTSNSDVLPQNSGRDPRVHIYTGSCGALTCIAGDDDSGAGFTAEVSFSVTAGNTYYIAWDNRWEDDAFDWELIMGTPPPPPAPITFTSFSVPVGFSGSDRAAVDMDGDGLDDLVAVTSTVIDIAYQGAPTPGNPPTPNWTLSEIVTTPANNTPSWSLAAADYDGNGYTDLLYGGGSGVTFMKANSDGTAFTEISYPQDIFSQRSNFIDINNDGHLDAFVCHDVEPNVYYLNDGSGNLGFIQGAEFDYQQSNPCETTDTSEPSYPYTVPTFIDNTGAPGSLGANCQGGNYGSLWVDYDNDRDMDLFLAKCRGGSNAHKYNELWQNDGNGGFVNVADGSGYYQLILPSAGHNNSSNLGDPVQTWSAAWADYDNDGDMDVYVGASSFSDGGHKYMKNNGIETGTFDFTDDSATALAMQSPPTGIENAPGDFNNDGWVDILTSGNILFNNGNGTFTLHSSGMPPSGAIGDFNGDGFLDVFNGNLRINDADNGNHWSKIRLIGVQSNIHGIGARIELNTTGLGTQIRDVRAGEGFRYMSTINAHFGIGAETTINSITIYWPSGTVDVLLNPAIDTFHTVTEGETLSLEDSLVEDLILYPNPTKDVLNLNATYGFENAVYTVFDLNGKRIMNSRFESNTIDVSNLSTGNYILRIMDNGRIKTQKFIKQ